QVAIIIPAYKQDYFERTLMALSNQTNKCFNVYIGDDNSPYDLEKIYLNYFNKLNGVYKRFDDNLGGTNLVAHWNRCLEMVGDEEWIWLFSDDDILDENCVQNFYNEIAKSEEHYDVYHFDVNVIGESDELLSAQKPFPKVLKVEDFILQRSAGNI